MWSFERKVVPLLSGSRPRGDAAVYGGSVVGDVVLAVGAQGAVLGRISSARPD
jgi:hypothetical protein